MAHQSSTQRRRSCEVWRVPPNEDAAVATGTRKGKTSGSTNSHWRELAKREHAVSTSSTLMGLNNDAGLVGAPHTITVCMPWPQPYEVVHRTTDVRNAHSEAAA
mmetsp:Transcript_53094/g.72725  ORF Transcript_53094/g.72725 Transcript_53094/m.72725 type:complete len:104 (-) Transcript_53094:387-698(-)